MVSHNHVTVRGLPKLEEEIPPLAGGILKFCCNTFAAKVVFVKDIVFVRSFLLV